MRPRKDKPPKAERTKLKNFLQNKHGVPAARAAQVIGTDTEGLTRIEIAERTIALCRTFKKKQIKTAGKKL